jgi:hypothetical protein
MPSKSLKSSERRIMFFAIEHPKTLLNFFLLYTRHRMNFEAKESTKTKMTINFS